MRVRCAVLAAALTIVSSLASHACRAAPTLTDLRCEARVNPLGVDEPRPRLSWVFVSPVRGERQTDYQVQAASGAARLAAGAPDLWDSGRVRSTRSTYVPYGGRRLPAAARCWWRVRVWGADGAASGWSAPARWVVGLPRPEDWRAVWIAARAEADAPSVGLGYHAEEAAAADDAKWVQVDLGRTMPIDAIHLVPLNHDGVAGFGFPLRFRLEVDDDPAFASPRMVADHQAEDYPSPGLSPVVFRSAGLRGRYVRLSVGKLWNRGSRERPFCFGLSELQVLSGGRNAALSAPVTARDSVEQWGWGHVQLTDGRLSAGSSVGDRYAAPLLRKEVTIGAGIRRATAFVCGLGYSELYINGAKVGESVLDPAWTDYNKRVCYRTYDVTRALRKGANAVGALLGSGWYRPSTPDLFGYEKASWVGPPKLLLQIRVERTDGRIQWVTSDTTWRRGKSPITFNCVRGGETVDARMAEPRWSRPGFDDRAWPRVVAVPAPKGRLVPQAIPPIRVTERIRPVRVTEPKPGVYVFDLGRHIAGYARLTARGAAGARVVLDFDENLNADGTITVKSLNSHTNGRYQTGELILSGGPADVFQPRFTYHGFRYVQVRGLTQKPCPGTLIGLAVHTDLQSAGSFECSNPVLNRIQQAVRYSILNCHHSIQTEPAREKVNWTEDAHNTVEPAILNFDYETFARKWLDDVLDSQEPNGHVPPINPTATWGKSLSNGAPPDWSDPWWAGVVVEIPWFLTTYYGDTDVLRRSYGPMKRYVDYLATTTKEWPFLDWWLGDWLEVGADGGRSTRTPIVQCSTMAYYHYAVQVARAARLLQRKADAERYERLAERIKAAYNARFLDPVTSRYALDSQSAQAMPLALGLAPADRRAAILQRLVENVGERKGHISAGFVGYQYVLRALTAYGRADLAYGMAATEEYPGWGHMVRGGGTTLWEAWNGSAFNFTSLGAVGAWVFEALGGIRPDPEQPGYRRIIVRPSAVDGLTWARASARTPYGKVAVQWRKAGAAFALSVMIPCGSTAEVWVPARSATAVRESGRATARAPHVRYLRMEAGCAVYETGSGRYRFTTLSDR